MFVYKSTTHANYQQITKRKELITHREMDTIRQKSELILCDKH